MGFLKKYFWAIVALAAILLLVRECSRKVEPKIKTKIETVTEWKHDTIKVVEIKKVDRPVYLERWKTIDGKDSIVYVDRPSENTIEANVYKTEVESNMATAKLDITALGEVLDVKGVITYPEITTTITNDIYYEKGGLFLYGSVGLNKSPELYEIGLDWAIKNKYLIGAGVNYNDITKNANVVFKVGVKLF